MIIKASTKTELTPKQRDELLAALKARFEKNMAFHQGLVQAKVQARLEANPEKLWSLAEMESTGGEPDGVGGQVPRIRFHGLRAGKSGWPARPVHAGVQTPRIRGVWQLWRIRHNWKPHRRSVSGFNPVEFDGIGKQRKP